MIIDLKVTKQRFSKAVVIWEGPQTLLWLRVQDWVGLWVERETRLEVDNDEPSTLENA